jgi:sugar phosphate isomerase/epimerase
MYVGIFAKTFSRPDLSATLDAVVASGLDTMQFNMALAPSTPAADIREETASHGLTMAAVSGTYNLAHPDAAVRADGRRWLADLIATAPTLGTSVVTLCTGSRDPDDMWRRHPDNGTPEAWRDMLESVAAALAVADAHDVTLGFEPEHNNVVDSAAAGRRLLEELRSTQLKVVMIPRISNRRRMPSERRSNCSATISCSLTPRTSAATARSWPPATATSTMSSTSHCSTTPAAMSR